MDFRYLFPYEFVERGSKIIIYGLGVCGKEYIKQIEYTKYCSIVAVSDTYGKDSNVMYPFLNTAEIKDETEYDYIVIAITKYGMVTEVYSDLLQRGIPKDKIVGPFQRNDGLRTVDKKGIEGNLRVLYTMAGGLGDAIMELCLYERLLEFDPEIIIDVYGEPYSKYVFSTKKNIDRIIDYNKEKVDVDDYDFVIQASWGITVQHINEERVGSKSKELLECLKKTQYDMGVAGSLITRIRKAQILKKDKFWLMGRGEIWKLDKRKIKVDLILSYEGEYNQLTLKRFITINCGADMRRVGEKQSPTKVWPRKNFEEFIKLFKREYPDISIVQLGDSNQTPLLGVDKALFGRSFEVVKYIMRDSMLHIDDEGGLVHLATALGTKCIVLFGPTPVDILGYKQNINICVNTCPGCFAYVNDWNANCIREDHIPKCMMDIDAQMVFDVANEYLGGQDGED